MPPHLRPSYKAKEMPIVSQTQNNSSHIKETTKTIMIPTPLRSKILSHTRSSSLPSRSHPLIPQFNHHLQQLNSSESTPSSLSSITKKLHCLDHLYNSIDDLLLLPHTQQVFARESRQKWAEEILDGYLSLVDACSTAKDLVCQTKQFLLDLLSVLRRRRDSDDLNRFLNARKTTKKTIFKCLRSISSLKNKPSVLALDKEEETIAIISMLKEAESATLEVMESLLVAVSGSKQAGSRVRGWSLVSRLMNPRKFSGRDVEFGEMDAALDKIVGFRTSTAAQVDELQRLLREMDVSIGNVEERVELLFKRLIRTRVSLLNMHSL